MWNTWDWPEPDYFETSFGQHIFGTYRSGIPKSSNQMNSVLQTLGPKGLDYIPRVSLDKSSRICFGLSSLLGQYGFQTRNSFLKWIVQPPMWAMCFRCWKRFMGVSKNGGTTKSSIVIGFSVINHPFWGTPIFGNTHINKTHGLLDAEKHRFPSFPKFPRYRKFIQKAASDHTERTEKKISEKQQQKVFFCQRRPCGDFITLRFFQMWFLNSDSYWPFLSKVGPKGFRVKHQRKTQQRSTWWFQIYFSKGLKPPTSDPWITSWTPPGRFPCADCRSAIQGAKDPKSLSRPRFDASPKLSLYQSRNMWM